jgi:Fic family protein
MGASDRYRFPHEFEPLMPQRRLDELAERSRSIVTQSLALTGKVHPATISSLRSLLREMNSYYSNRIEGQGTHPVDIARALRADYSTTPETARLQRIAVAHIRAEQDLEGPPTTEVLRISFLQRAHQRLYSELRPEDRTDSSGVPIGPGEFRTNLVSVGRHLPPDPDTIAAFGERFDAVYAKSHPLDSTLLAVAAAHHRASWIHPFADGNGRAVRLQTHCALFPYSGGLWSVSRGLARQRDAYYAHLEAADAPRSGDLDGRGNLSDAALATWCAWFLDVCGDQVEFMTSLLNLDGLRRRCKALLAASAVADSAYRVEMALPLFHLFIAGPTPRGEILAMSGLGERTARSALSHLIRVGLVTSPDHRSPVQIAFPLDALQILFPDLYPEAATRPL